MKKIPRELSAMYRDLFERIDKEPLESKRELARRAISWVLGAVRQLSADQLIEAVSSGYRDWCEEAVTRDQILSCCHHLLAYRSASDTIEFSHFSVVQYVEEEGGDDYCQQRVHSLLSRLSLNAMCEEAEAFAQLTSTSARGRRATSNSRETWVSFWCYATNYWAFHCDRSGAVSSANTSWREALDRWCEIEQVGSTAWVGSWAAYIDIDKKSIAGRIPWAAAQGFGQWIFMVSCKLNPCFVHSITN